MVKSSSANKFVSYKQFRMLTRLCKKIIKNQNNVIKTVRAITSFNPTKPEDIDPSTEFVSRPDARPGVSSVTKEKRSSKHKERPDLSDITTFFHNRKFTVQDDGKKPIKILNERGKKMFVVQRKSCAIFQKSPDGYKRVFIEDLV